MVNRVVIVRVDDHLLCLPFTSVDEILGVDRVVRLEDLPEGAVPGDASDPHWVRSRGKWLPMGRFLPGSVLTDRSQILIVRWEEKGRAFVVDQVMGIESTGKKLPFPESALPYTAIPFSGVRLWKGKVLLELDLSRLNSLN